MFKLKSSCYNLKDIVNLTEMPMSQFKAHKPFRCAIHAGDFSAMVVVGIESFHHPIDDTEKNSRVYFYVSLKVGPTLRLFEGLYQTQ